MKGNNSQKTKTKKETKRKKIGNLFALFFRCLHLSAAHAYNHLSSEQRAPIDYN